MTTGREELDKKIERRKNIWKLIGFLLGGLYGYIALNNFWGDIFDIFISIGIMEGNEWLINYPIAILLHGSIGYCVALFLFVIFEVS